MSWNSRLALGLLVAGSPGVAADPLYARNLAPVAGLIGFPVLRSARVLPSGSFVLELNSSVANTQTADSSLDEKGDEMVLLDGETWRVAPRLRYGFARSWELEAELPWLRHSGGELDRLIENWHELWGLPDGDRDDMPRDQLFYGYIGPDAAFAHADAATGLGDASLAVVKEVWRSPQSALSLRGNVKFASGDKDDWLGSGSVDYSLGLAISVAPAPASLWLWHGQVGYTRAGKIEQLGDAQKRNLWFAGLGVEWRAWEKLHLKLQIDSHAAPVDSSLEQIGDPAVQLTAGVTWAPAPRWELDFSFSEDIAVNTAADIVLQFG
ncbi:MAG: DUF3187 family protein, partial [Gammaproteobacteria bacterium]|nr:DUF3187 family protein [Gammaproteobacteria bacterium]